MFQSLSFDVMMLLQRVILLSLLIAVAFLLTAVADVSANAGIVSSNSIAPITDTAKQPPRSSVSYDYYDDVPLGSYGSMNTNSGNRRKDLASLNGISISKARDMIVQSISSISSNSGGIINVILKPSIAVGGMYACIAILKWGKIHAFPRAKASTLSIIYNAKTRMKRIIAAQRRKRRRSVTGSGSDGTSYSSKISSDNDDDVYAESSDGSLDTNDDSGSHELNGIYSDGDGEEDVASAGAIDNDSTSSSSSGSGIGSGRRNVNRSQEKLLSDIEKEQLQIWDTFHGIFEGQGEKINLLVNTIEKNRLYNTNKFEHIDENMLSLTNKLDHLTDSIDKLSTVVNSMSNSNNNRMSDDGGSDTDDDAMTLIATLREETKNEINVLVKLVDELRANNIKLLKEQNDFIVKKMKSIVDDVKHIATSTSKNDATRNKNKTASKGKRSEQI